ncbi:LysR substrate-binding domain-containing protein [Serratia nevei]|uniref:LysR substrate-binding domain-containing protein n=1 Tax=Serratia nevei TaxID=2703794 RepID=UPI00254317F6|nr:LysR substrate-binding domain-containing protein [Serratia nevei]EMB4114333.1 LysR family transcriptional regulator [Serratia marcescens]WIJ64814.1 LysR substrate-binding domain-containing protein [Serratia nevei]
MSVFPLDLNAMYFFTQVVEHKGFTAAGKALGIPTSRLSRQVAQLERQLNLRLLQRTSRRLQLTDVGHEVYQHCVAMMQQAHQAQQVALRTLAEPNGTVRFSVSPLLADEVIASILPTFMARFPRVNVETHVTARRVDLLEEGLDFTLRGLGIANEAAGLIQRRLGTAKWLLAASPVWLARHGAPATPQQLSDMPCLLYPPQQGAPGWRLYGPENAVINVPFSPRLSSDNLQVILHAALDGQGICGIPYYACRQALARGDLQEVLSGWHPQNGELVLLYPSRRGVPPAVKALIEFFCREIPPLLDDR